MRSGESDGRHVDNICKYAMLWKVWSRGLLDFGRANADLTALRFGTHYVSFRLA